MPAVQLDETLFKIAQQKASDAGYTSVDAYVADVLIEFAGEPEGRLFTTGRLARIDQASADINAGKGLTPEQVQGELASRREKWLQENHR